MKLLKRVLAFFIMLATVFSFLPAEAIALVQENAEESISPNNAEVVMPSAEDVFSKTDYQFSANWIWDPADNGEGNRWMIFRKDITLEKADLDGEITAKISADSKYWLYINGEMAVFEGQLKRGAALLEKDIYGEDEKEQPNLEEMLGEVATYYDEVVLTPYLREGENVIVALVYYYGNSGHSHVGSGKGAFLFESVMGSKKVISDESWKVSRHMGYQNSAAIGGHSQEYHTVYDARAGYDDFFKPEFDVSSWNYAKSIGKAGDKPWNELWQRSIPEWKVWDRVTFTTADTDNVTPISGGYRVKFPTNIHFSAYLKVSAPAGKTVKITCDNAGKYSVSYTTKGGVNGESVVQEYESPAWINWWYADFRIPEGVEVIELGYRRTGYNSEQVGYFESNDSFFNTLWTKARDTVYVNIRDTFMDCPDAERCPWLGDMVNEALIAYYTLDESVFDAIRKDISVRINWQNEDGVIPTTAPNTFRFNEYSELTGQSLAGIMSWFQYYLYSGDVYTLQQAYPALIRYIETFDLDAESYTVPFKRKDGTNTEHISWVDWGENIDKDLCLNIWAYIGVKTVVDFATVLGDTETAEYYSAVRDVMEAKFDSVFWNGKEYRSATYYGPADDRGQALAVYAGLVSPDKYPIIKELLLKNRFASTYMVKYSIEALYIMGYPEAAEQRMKESYANDVPLSDPTFSERWNGEGTKNHGWSGGGLISLSGYVAGVRPIEAGYERFLVKPQLGSQITDVKAGIPSVKGFIEVAAKKTETDISLNVKVPEGSQALVALPRWEGDTAVRSGEVLVWNDGEVEFSVEGLSYAYTDYSHIYFNVLPGEWSFTSSAAEKVNKETYNLKIGEITGGTLFLNGERIETPFEGSFSVGEKIVVKAVADEGYCFESYYGSLGGRDAELPISFDSDKSIFAQFVAIPKFRGYELHIGSYKKEEILVNGADATLPYSEIFEENTKVTLTALDGKKRAFSEWRDADGNIISTERELTLVIDQATEIFASYVECSGYNFASGKKIEASTSVENSLFSTTKITDGIYTAVDRNEGWSSDENLEEQWFILDLEEKCEIGEVRLYPRMMSGDYAYGIPEDLQIYVSDDYQNWKEVFSVKGQRVPFGEYVAYTFETAKARYVKVNGSKLHKNPRDNNKKRFQISEVEVYPAVNGGAPQIAVSSREVCAPVEEIEYASVIAKGNMPMYYQWQRSLDGGKTFEDIPNACNAAYPILFSEGISGTVYRCSVRNSEGEGFSENIVARLSSQNYAKTSIVTASGTVAGENQFRLRYINDGITETIVGSNEGWSSKNGTTRKEWVSFDMREVKAINRFVMYPRRVGADIGYGIPEDYTLSVSVDGENWKEVYNAVGTERPLDTCIVINFEPVEARYVKIEGVNTRVNPYGKRRMQIAEVEIYWIGEKAVKKGDVDRDGEVTVNDALLALRSVAKLCVFTVEDNRLADMDRDGEITVVDALQILRCVVGLAERPIG